MFICSPPRFLRFFGLLTIFCHVMDKSTNEYRALHPVRANIQRPIIRSLQNEVKSMLLRSIHFKYQKD